VAAQVERAADAPPGRQLSAVGQPRRVVLVAPFGLRPKGTTSARVLPIARVLAAQGARVRVVIPPWDDPGRASQHWEDGGVEIVHTSAGGGPVAGVRIVQELLRHTRSYRPDVVHCFKPIGYSGAVASILTASARRRGTPLVVVDADDLEGQTGWSQRRRLGIAGAVRGAQESSTLRGAPQVTVASAWLRQYLLELGRRAETILYLPNGHGVALETVKRRGSAQRTAPHELDGPTLLWYTRFTEVQPGRAADLIAATLARAPSGRLVIVGEELNPGDRAATAAALTAAGVAERIEWRGFEPDAVERWLKATSGPVVAIYPMDDDPTNRARCPSKIPQLMALGIPVVAEAVGEISAYLAEFEAECLVAPDDRDGFAARVVRLLHNDRMHGRLRRRLEAAAVHWRWETVAGGLLDWYSRKLAVAR
jgi:glycosyltransferase involved in cell wall biosynthesis